MTQTTRLLRDLVSLPSVNPMGRPLQGPQFLEHRVTAYLEEFFRGLGVPYERQTVAPQRDNIVARFDSPGARPTVVFEVHQDTVPTDGMTVDRDGRIYVTTRMGVQVLDQPGRVNTIIDKPGEGWLSNVVFGGPDFDVLYATCGEAVYSRKVKAKGFHPAEAPFAPPKPGL